MKFYQIALLAGLGFATVWAVLASAEVEFVILITSYNNERYAKANLRSVCHQRSSRPYQVICINDCSKDKTKEILDKYVRKHQLESFVTIIHNEKRVGALENIYNAIHSYIPNNKVVVSVDGDDTLPHNEVLLQLEWKYADPDIWMTYGSTLSIPEGHTRMSERIPDWVFHEKKLRKYDFVSQHLRTFKAGLFKKIRKEDFLYKGKFLEMTWDQAFMFPMLEMCSPKEDGGKNHSTYIPEILYIYNFANPINDFRVNSDLQYELSRYLRSLPPYSPIDTLEEEVS